MGSDGQARVGDELRKARESRGLSLDELSSLLRIRKAQLEALEQSRFGDLPGQTYAIGFVRSYAAELQLNTDDVVRRFKAELAGRDDHPELAFPVPAREGRFPGLRLIAVSVLLAGIVYGAWYVATSEDSPFGMPFGGEEESAAPVPSVDGSPDEEAATASVAPPLSTDAAPTDSDDADEAAAAETATEPGSEAAATAQNGGAAPAEPNAGDGPSETEAAAAPPEEPDVPPASTADEALESEAPVTAVTPEFEPSEAAESESTASTAEPERVEPEAADAVSAAETRPAATPPETAATSETAQEGGSAAPEETQPEVPAPPAETASTADGVPPSTGDARVILEATGDSWVQITAPDDQVLIARILRQGERFEVPNRSGLKLTTGNAGALVVYVDGAEGPSLGAANLVRRDISLDPADLLAN